MKDKTVFQLAAIDAQKLAHSYGLINAPQLTIVTKKKSSSTNHADDAGGVTDKSTAAQDRIAKLRAESKARKLQKQQ